jgi:hypothetical protein
VIIVKDSEDRFAECTMCPNRRRETPDMMMYEVTSTHPQRNMVITYCEKCKDELLSGINVVMDNWEPKA